MPTPRAAFSGSPVTSTLAKGFICEMKPLIVITLICTQIFTVFAQNAERKPENLTMTLASIADAAEPNQYIFIMNGVVAFKTLDGLKRHLMNEPKGSTLTWAPGCDRMGQEPLLRSKQEMQDFMTFCDSIGLKFVLVPSG